MSMYSVQYFVYTTLCPHHALTTQLQVLDTLAEIQERHGAVQALEKSLLVCFMIFMQKYCRLLRHA